MWATSEDVRRWHARAAGGLCAGTVLGALAATTTGEWSRSLGIEAAGALLLIGVVWVSVRTAPSHRSLLVWPYLTCAGLAGLGVVAPNGASLLVGAFIVCFLFVGLTQPPRTYLVLLPVALAAAWTVYDLPTRQALVRLTIAAAIWVVVAELPARLLRRLGDHRAILTREARTDPLTGLKNRSDLPAHLLHLESAASVTSMVLIDLDHFKRYNDAYGHLAGDNALADFGRALTEAVRSGDQAYRYGGEEFLLTLQGTPPARAVVAVERLRQRWSLHPSALTFSAGIGTSLEEADARLYRAKDLGRNQTVGEVSVAADSRDRG